MFTLPHLLDICESPVEHVVHVVTTGKMGIIQGVVPNTSLPVVTTLLQALLVIHEGQGNESEYTTTSSYCTGTSLKIIKNEVGCRDDTVPKPVETRRHCEED